MDSIFMAIFSLWNRTGHGFTFLGINRFPLHVEFTHEQRYYMEDKNEVYKNQVNGNKSRKLKI